MDGIAEIATLTIRIVGRLVQRSRQCEQTPAISITGLLGEKPAARHDVFECFRYGAAGCFADRAAMLADQEHHRGAVGMLVHACDEGVAAFDPVNEPVVAQKSSARYTVIGAGRPLPAASRSMIS